MRLNDKQTPNETTYVKWVHGMVIDSPRIPPCEGDSAWVVQLIYSNTVTVASSNYYTSIGTSFPSHHAMVVFIRDKDRTAIIKSDTGWVMKLIESGTPTLAACNYTPNLRTRCLLHYTVIVPVSDDKCASLINSYSSRQF